MDRDTKITRLIVRLNRATAEGELVWRATDPPSSLTVGTDDAIPVFFTARYLNAQIGVYEKRTRTSGFLREDSFWYSSVCFALLDSGNRVLWATSKSSALADLYATIREQVSGIDELLDRLIEEDDASTRGE